MEELIKSILDWHVHIRLLDCMHSIFKQLPPEEEAQCQEESRASTFDMGTVETIQRRLENITSKCECVYVIFTTMWALGI